MLVTLATSQTISAGSSATYTYSPNSLQKVFLKMEDADAEDAKVTVQIGSRTICNGISAYGLVGLTQLVSNQAQNISGSTGILCVMDFGNHECQAQDNIYVTVDAPAEVSAVDCSAIVDTPGSVAPPVKLTEYSDNTFTSSNNLAAISYDSAKAVVDEDAYNCEIRTSISSSSPSFISATSYYQSEIAGNSLSGSFGLLNKHSVPLKTTYNYNGSAVTDRILTIEQMGTSRSQQAQSRRSAQIAVSQAGK